MKKIKRFKFTRRGKTKGKEKQVNSKNLTTREHRAYARLKSPHEKIYDMLVNTSGKELRKDMLHRTNDKILDIVVGEAGSFESWCLRYFRDLKKFDKILTELSDGKTKMGSIEKDNLIQNLSSVINKKKNTFEKLFNDFLVGRPIIHPISKSTWKNTDNIYRGTILRYILSSEYATIKSSHFFTKLLSDIMEKYTETLKIEIPTKKPSLNDTLIKGGLGLRSFTNLNFIIQIVLGSKEKLLSFDDIFDKSHYLFPVPSITTVTKEIQKFKGIFSDETDGVIIIRNPGTINSYRMGNSLIVLNSNEVGAFTYKKRDPLEVRKDLMRSVASSIRFVNDKLNSLRKSTFRPHERLSYRLDYGEVENFSRKRKRINESEESDGDYESLLVKSMSVIGYVYFTVKGDDKKYVTMFLPFHYYGQTKKEANISLSTNEGPPLNSNFYCGIMTQNIMIAMDSIWYQNGLIYSKIEGTTLNKKDRSLLDYMERIKKSPFNLNEIKEMIKVQELIRYIFIKLAKRDYNQSSPIVVDLSDGKIIGLLDFKLIGLKESDNAKTIAYFDRSIIENQTKVSTVLTCDRITITFMRNEIGLFQDLAEEVKIQTLCWRIETYNLEKSDVNIELLKAMVHRIMLKLIFAKRLRLYDWLGGLVINWKYKKTDLKDILKIKNPNKKYNYL